MLGINLRDKKTIISRQQTKVVDVMTRIASLKWNWAGHIARKLRDMGTFNVKMEFSYRKGNRKFMVH